MAGDRNALARLVSSAVDGHPDGAAFLDALADRIAVGAAALCVVVDPGFLVLGGEVGRSGGAELAGRVSERLARLVPLPTEVVPGTVGLVAQPDEVSGLPAAGHGEHDGQRARPGDGALAGNPVVRGAVLVALDLLRAETFAGPAPRGPTPG